jgi:hypothetical protein
MKPLPSGEALILGAEDVPRYGPSGDYTVGPRSQPYYKLHGSSNWRDRDGRLIIALGGTKPAPFKVTKCSDMR